MPLAPYFSGQRIVLNMTTNTNMASNQFRGIQLFASNTVGVTISNTVGNIGDIGIQTDLPISVSGANVGVCVFGPTVAIAGNAFSAGAELVLAVNNTAPGYVYDASSVTGYGLTGTFYHIGMALESAAAASQMVTIFVNPRVIRRA